MFPLILVKLPKLCNITKLLKFGKNNELPISRKFHKIIKLPKLLHFRFKNCQIIYC